MKKEHLLIITFLIGIISTSAVVAQNSEPCEHRYQREFIKVDSLNKVIIKRDINYRNMIDTLRHKNEELDVLRKDIMAYSKMQKQKNLIESKTDSIRKLNREILLAVDSIKEKCLREKNAEFKEYNNKRTSKYNSTFDALTNIKVLDYLNDDIKHLDSSSVYYSRLRDLIIYFGAKDLLSKKFDSLNNQVFISQLQEIKNRAKNTEIDKLLLLLENQYNIKKGLSELIITICQEEKVEGISKSLERIQYQRINELIATFIFDYEFNNGDYPYYAQIINEILTKKKEDIDADMYYLISDL